MITIINANLYALTLLQDFLQSLARFFLNMLDFNMSALTAYVQLRFSWIDTQTMAQTPAIFMSATANEHLSRQTSEPMNEQINEPISGQIVEATKQGQEVINNLSGVVSIEAGLILAVMLFVIGLYGVLSRKNWWFVFISLQVMMNAVAMIFVFAGSRWLTPDGQMMYVFIVSLLSAQVAVVMAFLLRFYLLRNHRVSSYDGGHDSSSQSSDRNELRG